MFEENPDKTNATEDAREEEGAPSNDAPVETSEQTEEQEGTAEADEAVPEGVAESAAGTEEASDAGEEPPAVPEDASEAVEEQPASPDDVAGDSEPVEEPAVIAAEEAPEPAAEPAPEAAEPMAEVSELTAEAEAPAPEATSEPVAPAEPSGDGDAAAAPAVEEEVAGDPYSGPGDWYVIHTYAGYENKVKTNLASRIQTMQMQDKIFDVVIPMEDVMEIKGGRKQVVQKKVFPGYLLVKMIYDDESWFVVRNTPGVTGFVSSGTGQKPTPLSRREVERIIGRKKEEAKPAFRLDFEVDDVVRIISGPFADFNGTIAEINVDQSKVKVMVNIFDRETPVELGFDQVARV
jgi:transcription termination/antitermination protein NusG